MSFSSVQNDILDSSVLKMDLNQTSALLINRRWTQAKRNLKAKQDQATISLKSPPAAIMNPSVHGICISTAGWLQHVLTLSSGPYTRPPTPCVFCWSKEPPFWPFSWGFPGHPHLSIQIHFSSLTSPALALLKSFPYKPHSHLAPRGNSSSLH